MTDKTEIAVIICSRNGERYLGRAIDSVLRQEFTNFEFLIFDDNSHDKTFEIASDYAKRDSRIKVFRNDTPKGIGVARAKAVSMTTAPYIAFLDDDDSWSDTGKLAKQVSFLKQNPEYTLVGCQTVYIVDEQQQPFKTVTFPQTDEEIRATQAMQNNFLTPATLYPRTAYEKVGGFVPYTLAEDYDLYMKLGTVGKMHNLNTCTITVTARPDSESHKRYFDMALYQLIIFAHNGIHYPNKLKSLFKNIFRVPYRAYIYLTQGYKLY